MGAMCRLGATGQADYDALAAKAEADPAWLMEEVFKFCDVRFYRRYDQMLDVSRGQPWARWCVGGTTNMVLNCIDKHRDTAIWHQTFLVWEGEDRRERRSRLRAGAMSAGSDWRCVAPPAATTSAPAPSDARNAGRRIRAR
jgi:acetyl-CoA synthetase